MPYSQAGRLMALDTPLGADALLLERLDGVESISELFRLELRVLSLTSNTWAFDQLLGQGVTVKLSLPDNSFRYLNGIVSRIAQADHVQAAQGQDTFTRYVLEVVPRLWLLSLNQKSRTFQQIAVPDILKQALTGLDVSWELQGEYKPRDYCVQYRESDFDFASRLMEEEGIYYYFKHANGSHKIVVADTPQSHESVVGAATVSYQPGAGGLHPDDRIFTWQKAQQVRAGKITLWDQCFELPQQNLEAVKSASGTVSAGSASHKLAVGGNDGVEVYDYPGLYAQRFDGTAPGGGDRASDVQNIFSDNARTAAVRMRREQAPALEIAAAGNCRNLASGHKFTLADHFDGNGDYVLTRVEHFGSQEGVYTSMDAPEAAYECRFRCLPAALPYAPPERTPRPRIAGPQTAVVVGPAGEEIFTDKYSRVKVQFPWDRDGKKDAASSCWVRVGTLWAGTQWGAIHIPRIGQEVIVAFEDGDPDRPIIVGSVYNADNMPPYTLPDNRTQSGIKSRSSLQGSAENFNELRFEDKKDSEEIYFHAEKDFNRVVENNDTLKVGFLKKDKGDRTVEVFNNEKISIGAGKTDAADGSQTVDIFNNQTLTVGSGKANAADGSQTITIYKNRTTTIEEGDETLTVKKGKRTETVEGDDTLTVKTGNRAVTIKTGNDDLTVSSGNLTIKVSAGTASVEAAQKIELKCGGSTITMEPAKITIKSAQISIQGDAKIEVKAPMVSVQGDAKADIKSPMTTVNGDGMLTLKGGVTMIN